ncbi:hypothetical protein [Alkaliphilus sp. B6464]|uniref:hypothetical protein n=1 Tax=Alkaliphilus sp. B6464 TaxID=2731219 RepID=UPI001BA6F7FD|nr:hypothetical protein [Alkaliphilus sp. B6464]QUH21757.1 hypothetical protein HYG84_17630 [Alkaliphilus sp. B6464]
MNEKIELPKECGNLILSIFRKYKAGEPLTPSTKDSIETVEIWLKRVMPKEN